MRYNNFDLFDFITDIIFPIFVAICFIILTIFLFNKLDDQALENYNKCINMYKENNIVIFECEDEISKYLEENK